MRNIRNIEGQKGKASRRLTSEVSVSRAGTEHQENHGSRRHSSTASNSSTATVSLGHQIPTR